MGDPAYEIRTVDRLVAVLNQGDDGSEATRHYRDIMARLAELQQEHGGKHKGQLTLTFDFAGDAKGVDVTLTVKSKIPGRPILKERYFLSETNVLTLQDPARETLFPGADLGRRKTDA
jgi:hypothetical protein